MKSKLLRTLTVALAFLALAGIAVACGGAAPAPAPTAPPAAQPTAAAPSGSGQAVDLKFIVWSYGVETILDNIKNFQTKNPGITVALQDFSWLNYHDTVVQRAAANTPTDLLYSSDHWIQEWADAGWLEPLETHCPNVNAYVKDMAPFAADALTYKGHVYGLPYYAATMVFIYNEDQLKQAGFDKPPATWEELATQAKAIKAKGINEFPIVFTFSQQEGASPEIFYAMVYSQADAAGSMFDKDNNATFNTAASPAKATVDWLTNALQTDKTLDPASLQLAEIDMVKSMQAGAHTFTVTGSYDLAELNKPGSGPSAGKFKMALIPGKSHYTSAFSREYSMSPTLPKRGQAAVDAACKFLDYFAGKTDGQYVVVKRWAVENGLTFAQMPLYQDPDVVKAFGAWGDVNLLQEQTKLARSKEGLTPFFGSWDVFARAELQKAYLGQESSQQALDNMATKWNDLKAGK